MQKSKGEQSNIHLVANLKSEKEELESLLSKEKMHSLQLKQELSEAENRDTELYKVTSTCVISLSVYY
jgi:hypothetical protein